MRSTCATAFFWGSTSRGGVAERREVALGGHDLLHAARDLRLGVAHAVVLGAVVERVDERFRLGQQLAADPLRVVGAKPLDEQMGEAALGILHHPDPALEIIVERLEPVAQQRARETRERIGFRAGVHFAQGERRGQIAQRVAGRQIGFDDVGVVDRARDAERAEQRLKAGRAARRDAAHDEGGLADVTPRRDKAK